MIGLGTIANTIAVIIGGCIGLFLKKGIKKSLQDSLLQAMGIAVLFIGIGGTLSQMLVFKDGHLETTGTMLMIFSLLIGTLIGEIINIEAKLEKLGEIARKILHADEQSKFVDAFVTVTLVICIGAMAIIGALQDGLSGDYNLLLTKAILDSVICMVFASTMGAGVLLAALPLFIYQGLITLCASFISPYLTTAMINDICYIGNILITIIGINLTFNNIIHIRVGNMLLALIVPVVYHIFS
ncbi:MULTISPECIES: DUF554 domain-containing protein [Megamonas]|uniref:DUF554 domain-containing protein n=1 Tax=Megamonas TaxID=158846 RepID=UPI0022E423E2|nr:MULTISPECIES: DUF554 domain-containing protein [Megamonas]